MTTYAIKWFGHMLMNAKLCDTLSIYVENDLEGNHCGEVEEHYNDGRRPRTFTIRVHPNLSKRKYLLTLAHEMSHVKQYASGELRDGVKTTRWRGEVYETEPSYFDSPWEIDAYGRELGLYLRFKEHLNAHQIIFRKPVKFYKKRVQYEQES